MENTKHLNGYIEEKDDTFYPTCRFCGKQTLPDAPYLSQDEANEAATIRCDCFEAREYQEKLRKEKERADNIIKLRQRLDDFSEYSASRGVELTGELHDFIVKRRYCNYRRSNTEGKYQCRTYQSKYIEQHKKRTYNLLYLFRRRKVGGLRMKDKTPKIIAVDFDGTLCTNAYPEIGEPIPYSLLYVTRAKAAGHIITLHTCRQGKFLDDAIAWCKARGITFDYINENVPANIKRFGGDTRKIYADVYFDANSLNPLRTFGIGDNVANAELFDRAEELTEKALCNVACLCPQWKAAGMCCECDVFYSLRDYHAEQLANNKEK